MESTSVGSLAAIPNRGKFQFTLNQYTAVWSFSTLAEAEACRNELVATAHQTLNPFVAAMGHLDFGRKVTLACVTSMDEAIFLGRLSSMGLEPPAFDAEAKTWIEWYDAQTPTMTDAQRCRVWQALYKLRFFETIETEVEV